MTKKGNVKSIIALLISWLLLLSGLVYADTAYAGWNTTIHASGQNLGGVSECNVVIGVDNKAETLPAPPAPPRYSVLMGLNTPQWEAVSKDVRQEGESNYIWVIGIDPHGNMMPPLPRTSTISWNPLELGDGDYELREGYDGQGNVVVTDMKATASYDVVGGSTVQYFTVVYKK